MFKPLIASLSVSQHNLFGGGVGENMFFFCDLVTGRIKSPFGPFFSPVIFHSNGNSSFFFNRKNTFTNVGSPNIAGT